jgi:hypothetical protein
MFNIGGVKFETCANTINNVPDSVLFELINTNSTVKPYLVEGRSTYFIDRDPKHFSVILNYLRNGGRYHSDMLPRDLRQLKTLMMLHYQPFISFLLSDSGTDYHQLDPQSYWALHEPYQQPLEF